MAQRTPMPVEFGPAGSQVATNPFWGVTNAHGQCLGFFTAFQRCYVEADVPERECKAWKDDYTECKLHRREKERLKRINEERQKQVLAAKANNGQ